MRGSSTWTSWTIVVQNLGPSAATPVGPELSELPDYVVATEEMADVVGGGAAFLEVALDPPASEDASDLPDYIVRADDVVLE